ncbi:hypothetical protein EDM57_06145 [Brevibacillus gelatini]|uniref:Uncharacterized protein n=1 Tax=Brevibacillus gelatini TaxID=1655277 RepID=A0A3M8B6Y9_9BACL|nr:hypothetical protein EDM57_06145 [Brevibacillus gelatini]
MTGQLYGGDQHFLKSPVETDAAKASASRREKTDLPTKIWKGRREAAIHKKKAHTFTDRT